MWGQQMDLVWHQILLVLSPPKKEEQPSIFSIKKLVQREGEPINELTECVEAAVFLFKDQHLFGMEALRMISTSLVVRQA